MYREIRSTEAEQKAAEAAEQAAKEYESSIKNSITEKFRSLETEQLEKGCSDEWLLAKKDSFLETLDHNSEAYKDYHLKILQEQKNRAKLPKRKRKAFQKQLCQALKRSMTVLLNHGTVWRESCKARDK
ncbi:MAG: hypothetical protein NC120_06695 [Ruminococcus sp.]|nr:hypothetical protein [Ruminococcus sp.]